MAELSDRYRRVLAEISSHISNKEEKKYVEKKVIELSSIYLELLDRLTKMSHVKMNAIEESQAKLIEKVARIQDAINLIQNDIYEWDSYDFEIICPYCNHSFITEMTGEYLKEIECPECHNKIELDWDEKEKKQIPFEKKEVKTDDEDDEF